MARSSNRSPRQAESQNTYSEKRDIHGAIEVSGTITAEVPQSLIKEYRSSSKVSDIRDRWRFMLEAGTFVSVIVVVIFSYVQTSQSIKSAEAARESVGVSSDTEIRQLRAYIGIHQTGFQGLEDESPLGVGYSFVNYGQTPAKTFNFSGDIDLLPYPLPPDYALPALSVRPKQDSVIFPKQDNTAVGWVWLRTGLSLSPKQKIALLSTNASQEIYAHGIATYVDMFGKTHHSIFCFYLNPSSIPRNPDGTPKRDKDGRVIFQWAPVASKNDVD